MDTAPAGQKPTRICTGCGLEKDTKSEFYWKADRHGKRRPYSRCKPCHRLLITDWQRRNKDRLASQARSRYLVHGTRRQLTYRFKMREPEMEDLLLFLGNRCAICYAGPKKNALAIDHDHQTGKVRGLLCTGCNIGLGHLERDGGRWRVRALAYLTSPVV